MTNAEIFRRAADYIREHGLWKGPYGGPPASRCAWGAIEGDSGEFRIALGEAAAKRATGSDHLHHLFRWNDAPGRTAEDVIALLDGLAFDEDLKVAATEGIAAPSGNGEERLHDPVAPETGGLVSQPQLVEAR